MPKWAYEDRLVDLEGGLGPLLDLFDADAVDAAMLLNGSTGRRGLYTLPMGRSSNYIHVSIVPARPWWPTCGGRLIIGDHRDIYVDEFAGSGSV